MSLLLKLVKTLLENEVVISGCQLVENNLAFVIEIGSKTGIGTLYEEDGKVYLNTRYNQTDEITCFKDISNIAFDWYIRYSDREVFNSPSKPWATIWIKEGKIEEQLTKSYKIL